MICLCDFSFCIFCWYLACLWLISRWHLYLRVLHLDWSWFIWVYFGIIAHRFGTVLKVGCWWHIFCLHLKRLIRFCLSDLGQGLSGYADPWLHDCWQKNHVLPLSALISMWLLSFLHPCWLILFLFCVRDLVWVCSCTVWSSCEKDSFFSLFLCYFI